MRRKAVTVWLDYLRHHHHGYRCIIIDEGRLRQFPGGGNAMDAIPQSQVEAADVGPEKDQEAGSELEDAAAMSLLLAKDTELDALRSAAVSRVRALQGLMLDAPFDRNHLTYASPPEGIKMKMRDQQLRKRQVLIQNPYRTTT